MALNPDPPPIKYRAFLSYAHANENWARWLHRRLERFRIDNDLVGRATHVGPVPATLGPIFRDQEEFTAGQTLDRATVAALDASACLIVLCSPVSAMRPMVNEEVRLFRSRHPTRPVIPVIIDGVYPDNFPTALRFEIGPNGEVGDRPVTILGPDLRDSAEGRFLGLAKIVAGMTGVGTDEIVRRAEREQRRRARWWIAGSSSVALTLAGLAGLAFWQHRIAAAERDNALTVQSRFLADTAERLASAGNAVSGMLVALEGLPGAQAGGRRPYVAQAEVGLYHALHHRRERAVLAGSGYRITRIVVSPDDREIYLLCSDHKIRVVAVGTLSLIRILDGHSGYLTTLRFSPDGARLVTAAADGTAQIWRRDTGARELVLRGHSKSVHRVEFSPDGLQLLTVSGDGSVRLWDTASGAASHVFRLTGRANRTAHFDPTGRYVATRAAGQDTELWDAATGKLVGSFRQPDINVFTFNPRGGGIVVQPKDGDAIYWSIERQATVATLPRRRHRLLGAAFSPNGQLVATSGLFETTIHVWDIPNARLLLSIETGEQIDALAFSPDGSRLITRLGPSAKLWDVGTGAQVGTLGGHTERITSLQYIAGGSKILSAANDGTVRVWDAHDGRSLAILAGHEILTTNAMRYIDQVVPIEGGARVVTYSSWDKTARIWDIANFIDAPTTPAHPNRVSSAAFTSDSRAIFTTTLDDRLRLFDVRWARPLRQIGMAGGSEGAIRIGAEGILAKDGSGVRILHAPSGREIRSFHAPGHSAFSIAATLDGTYVATGGTDGVAHIWDVATGRRVCTVAGHGKREDGQPHWVTGVAFDPGGRYLASSGHDNLVRFWDARTCAAAGTLPGHGAWLSSVAFSPHGSTVLSGSFDMTARLGDFASKTPIRIFKGHEQIVTRAVFSPDGRRIATGSNDKTARVWEVETGATVAHLRGHLDAVATVDFSADGALLVTASEDKTARIWKILPSTQALADYVTATVPRCLTQAERARFFLPPEPPRWCITGPGRETDNPRNWKGTWPYDTERWRTWLAARDRGANPPLASE